MISYVSLWYPILQGDGGDGPTLLIGDGLVVLMDHMQYDIVVGGVVMMLVLVPVRRLDMDLDVASPQGVSYLYLGIEKVWARVMIVDTVVDDLHRHTLGRLEVVQTYSLGLPDHVQEGFSHLPTLWYSSKR